MTTPHPLADLLIAPRIVHNEVYDVVIKALTQAPDTDAWIKHSELEVFSIQMGYSGYETLYRIKGDV
jgi:hypothetical protein